MQSSAGVRRHGHAPRRAGSARWSRTTRTEEHLSRHPAGDSAAAKRRLL